MPPWTAWPEGYSMPYNVLLNNKNWVRDSGLGDSHHSEPSWASIHYWEGGERLPSLGMFFSPLFPSLIVTLSSSQPMSFHSFSSPSIPLWWGREWASGWGMLSCWPGSTHHTSSQQLCTNTSFFNSNPKMMLEQYFPMLVSKIRPLCNEYKYPDLVSKIKSRESSISLKKLCLTGGL